jgi:hypothetical protein
MRGVVQSCGRIFNDANIMHHAIILNDARAAEKEVKSPL